MNEYQRKQKEAVEIKRNYPAGTRIELNEMIDTYSPSAGYLHPSVP